MEKFEIELDCRKKVADLLEKHFPDFIHEAAIEKPEQLASEYNDELPHKIEVEYREWLSSLWEKVAPAGAKPFDEMMNMHLSMSMVDADYVPNLKDAWEDARTLTLWEKITKTNHKDVTFYKGLLKQYTEELLETMTKDFLGDIES
ncbi:MAG: hypothetical protein ACI3ZL_06490 [Candidatus Cryptobacteroides sp.]